MKVSKKEEKKLLQLLEKARDEQNDRFQNAPMNMDFTEFENYMSPSNKKVSLASKKWRQVRSDFTFHDIPDYGDKMTLKDFIENVECGGFIDYDGYGNYATAEKCSDIDIYPSDVKRGFLRDDFEFIIWYNR